MKALILAAGNSERLRTVLGDLPKPLAKVNGKPLIEYNIELLKKHGITDIWINLHYQGRVIMDAIGDGQAYGVKISYSFEDEILGTAGAVRKLEHEWDSTFLVVYGDNISDIDISEMISEHNKSGALMTVAVFDPNTNPNTGIAGSRIIVSSDGFIARFTEGKEAESGLYVNAGIYVIDPILINSIPQGVFSDFGKDIIPNLLKDGERILAYKIKGYCLGPDTPETLLNAEEFFANASTKNCNS